MNPKRKTNTPNVLDQDHGLSVRGAWRGLVVTCVIFLVVGFVTLPRFPYPGDNFVPRIEAIHLVKYGQLGIPYEMRARLSGLDNERGQYFFSNDAKQRFYSKYGIAFTIAFLPPILAELASGSPIDIDRQMPSLYFKLGIYQLLLGLLTMYYLFRIAWLFGKSQWWCCVFTLVTVYTTFLWHYLRAPANEVYQIVAFAGVCAHALLFIRRRDTGDASVGCWGHLLAASLWGGVLVLAKCTFVLLGLAVSLFALFVGPTEKKFWVRPFDNLLRYWKEYGWSLVLPWIISFAALLGSNAIRFESVFDMGYMQWVRADGLPVVKFSLSYLGPAFKSFILDILKNDFNIFHAYPPAFLGVLCFIPFARRWARDALFIMSAVVPGVFLLLIHNYADGQWCYGPRYFLYYTILLAVPFLWGFEQFFVRLWKPVKPLVAVACMVPVLYLGWLEFNVNAVHYFVSYYLGGFFAGSKHPDLIAYNSTSRHKYCRDLFYYGQGWSSYYPLDVIRKTLPPNRREDYLRCQAMFLQQAQPNFYFFPGKQSK
ncbi:MAG: hypothetical protein WCK89_05170 [bacterium]